MKRMCAWAGCTKDGTISVTGDFGIADLKSRIGFCCMEHLAFWAIRKIALPSHGIGTRDEKRIEEEVKELTFVLRGTHGKAKDQA